MNWRSRRDLGGAFIYGMNDTHWSVGFVTGSTTRTHHRSHGNPALQDAPLVRALLEWRQAGIYGAKRFLSGYWAMPS